MAYNIFEKHLNSSLHINVMHHFWRNDTLSITLIICAFQCQISIYIHNKISYASHTPSTSNLCQNIEQRYLFKMGRVKRIWYLSPMRAAKVQASLRIRTVSPEPPLLAHTSSESRGTFRQKARSLAPLNGWACAVKICHDGMLEDTNSLDGVQMIPNINGFVNKLMKIASCYVLFKCPSFVELTGE